MVASTEGHVDIVRMLIDANAQVNKQDEVCSSVHHKNYILCFGIRICNRYAKCISLNRMALLLFTWLLKKEGLMW